LVLSGCGTTTTEGDEKAAREHLTNELNKWVSGEKNDASVIQFVGSTPKSYEIKNLIPGKAHPLMSLREPDGNDAEIKTYPSYQSNVSLEFKSEAETPTTRLITYCLTWSKAKKKWYLEQLL
jgi:hypothetical protein